MEYWTKREQADARIQLGMSTDPAVRPQRHCLHNGGHVPPFQTRQLEDEMADPSHWSPLIAQCFNLCVMEGCRQSVLKVGRLYHKGGHRGDPFEDRYFVLIHDHLIEFETTRRNIQKRPVPLAYHRRIRSIRLRDVYLITAESCSEFMARPSGESSFDPASDQSSLSRIYKDGLVALDDPMDCTFALWRQKGSDKQAGLGRAGKAFVFQARSKLERDQW